MKITREHYKMYLKKVHKNPNLNMQILNGMSTEDIMAIQVRQQNLNDVNLAFKDTNIKAIEI